MSLVPGFRPSTNAPLFSNGPWPAGTSFGVSIDGLPAVNIDATMMGFCGGMSFLARDIFESGMPQLRGTSSSQIPMALAQLILARLIQSFDGPVTVAQWLAFTQKLDHDTVLGGPGVFHLTVNECPAIMADIDAGRLCPIGVVLIQSLAPWDVFQNHVELIWGYELAGSQLTLHVYDCNRPGRDDITIGLDISTPTPAKTITTNGTEGPNPGQVRGFFRLPYTRADPSAAYIDDAVVTIPGWPPAQMAPGSQATVDVQALNTGSTSWSPGLNYRLGSQAPQDNTTWGTNRVNLPVARVARIGHDVGGPAVLEPARQAEERPAGPRTAGQSGLRRHAPGQLADLLGDPAMRFAVRAGQHRDAGRLRLRRQAWQPFDRVDEPAADRLRRLPQAVHLPGPGRQCRGECGALRGHLRQQRGIQPEPVLQAVRPRPHRRQAGVLMPGVDRDPAAGRMNLPDRLGERVRRSQRRLGERFLIHDPVRVDLAPAATRGQVMRHSRFGQLIDRHDPAGVGRELARYAERHPDIDDPWQAGVVRCLRRLCPRRLCPRRLCPRRLCPRRLGSGLADHDGPRR